MLDPNSLSDMCFANTIFHSMALSFSCTVFCKESVFILMRSKLPVISFMGLLYLKSHLSEGSFLNLHHENPIRLLDAKSMKLSNSPKTGAKMFLTCKLVSIASRNSFKLPVVFLPLMAASAPEKPHEAVTKFTCLSRFHGGGLLCPSYLLGIGKTTDVHFVEFFVLKNPSDTVQALSISGLELEVSKHFFCI